MSKALLTTEWVATIQKWTADQIIREDDGIPPREYFECHIQDNWDTSEWSYVDLRDIASGARDILVDFQVESAVCLAGWE